MVNKGKYQPGTLQLALDPRTWYIIRKAFFLDAQEKGIKDMRLDVRIGVDSVLEQLLVKLISVLKQNQGDVMALKDDLKAILAQGALTGANLVETRGKVEAVFQMLDTAVNTQKETIAALNAKILELEANGADPADVAALKELSAQFETGVQSLEDAAQARLDAQTPVPETGTSPAEPANNITARR